MAPCPVQEHQSLQHEVAGRDLTSKPRAGTCTKRPYARTAFSLGFGTVKPTKPITHQSLLSAAKFASVHIISSNGPVPSPRAPKPSARSRRKRPHIKASSRNLHKETLRIRLDAHGKLQLYLAFVHPTTRIPVKGCKFRLHAHAKMQLYLAFVRPTTPIPVKGCKFHFDAHQKMQLSLAFVRPTTPIPVKGCKFTIPGKGYKFCNRPRQSL